jgi:hypothetical protein
VTDYVERETVASPLLRRDNFDDAAPAAPALDAVHVALEILKLLHGGFEDGDTAVGQGVICWVEPRLSIGIWRRGKLYRF